MLWKRRGRIVMMALVIAATALMVAACGGDEEGEVAPTDTAGQDAAPGGEDGSGVEEAKRLLAEHRGVPTWEPPGPAFDATQAFGKSVYFSAAFLDNEYTVGVLAGFEEGLEGTDVDVTFVDNQGDPAAANRQIEQAIAQNADLIITHVLAAELLAPALDLANEAGIPVLQFNVGDPELPSEFQAEHGVVANFTYNYTELAYLQGAAAIAASDGNLTGVVIWPSDIPVGQLSVNGLREAFTELCPECNVEYAEAPLSQWQRNLPTITQNAASDQSINYLLPVYDSMVPLMLPAVHAANAADRVSVVTTNANRTAMEALGAGDVVGIDIGNALEYQGWALLDQTLRVLAGEPPLADLNVPFRVFDETNIDEIDVAAPESEWYGEFPAEFKEGFRALWTMSES